MRIRRGWLDLFRTLGRSLLELLEAEVRALTDDLKASGRRLAGALLLFAIAGFFVFWACGVLAYLLVEVLTWWVPRSGAVAIVLGILVLAAAILAAIGWSRLRKLEGPAQTFRRRMDESLGWWQESVLELEPGDEEAGAGDRE